MTVFWSWKEKDFVFKPEKVILDDKASSFLSTFATGELKYGSNYRMIISIEEAEGYVPSEDFLRTVVFRPYITMKNSTGFFFDEQDCKTNKFLVNGKVTLSADFFYRPSKQYTVEDHARMLAKADMTSIGIELFASERQTMERFVYTIESFAEDAEFNPSEMGREWYDKAKDAIKSAYEASGIELSIQKGGVPLRPAAETSAPNITEPKIDTVNHPSHYNATPVDTWEMFILANNDRPDYIKGALLFNIMKYKDRAGKKIDKEEDIKKMLWHLERLETLFGEDTKLYDLYHLLKTTK